MFWDLRISYFFERKVIFLETGNQFLGTERVSKLMRQYAIPCIISLLVGALYNIVDQIFIANASYLGSYGTALPTLCWAETRWIRPSKAWATRWCYLSSAVLF